jgi:hypothetical protein
MSTLLRTRRMPAKYRLGKNGITEIVYNATPEVFVVLPGTRWLEQRREREARLAAEAALLEAETKAQICEETVENSEALLIEPEADFNLEPEFVPEFTYTPQETVDESLSWTERMQIASTKLIRRQVSAHA